jgi:hypothetical protein
LTAKSPPLGATLLKITKHSYRLRPSSLLLFRRELEAKEMPAVETLKKITEKATFERVQC